MHSRLAVIVFFLSLAVPTAAQNITINNNLGFGSLFPGIPKTIDKSDAGLAAEFYVSGIAGDEVLLEFTLPRYMNSGSNTIQLVFSETDCSIDTAATPDQSDPIFDDLDPWHDLTYRLGSNGMMIWLGGMAIPKLVQPEGSYSGPIVLTVSYISN